MDYTIFSNIAPAMPKPSKGTVFVKFAITQASKDMQEVLIPMAIPALAAHLTDVKFMYPDNKHYEMCGQIGHPIGPSGIGKTQLGHQKTCKSFTPKQVNAIIDNLGETG